MRKFYSFIVALLCAVTTSATTFFPSRTDFRDEQIYFLSHESEDHAVAVLERSRSNGLVDRLDDFLSELLAYFR